MVGRGPQRPLAFGHLLEQCRYRGQAVGIIIYKQELFSFGGFRLHVG
jgi:hypothetical protein